jgi:hypothetical protein
MMVSATAISMMAMAAPVSGCRTAMAAGAPAEAAAVPTDRQGALFPVEGVSLPADLPLATALSWLSASALARVSVPVPPSRFKLPSMLELVFESNIGSKTGSINCDFLFLIETFVLPRTKVLPLGAGNTLYQTLDDQFQGGGCGCGDEARASKISL